MRTLICLLACSFIISNKSSGELTENMKRMEKIKEEARLKQIEWEIESQKRLEEQRARDEKFRRATEAAQQVPSRRKITTLGPRQTGEGKLQEAALKADIAALSQAQQEGLLYAEEVKWIKDTLATIDRVARVSSPGNRQLETAEDMKLARESQWMIRYRAQMAQMYESERVKWAAEAQRKQQAAAQEAARQSAPPETRQSPLSEYAARMDKAMGETLVAMEEFQRSNYLEVDDIKDLQDMIKEIDEVAASIDPKNALLLTEEQKACAPALRRLLRYRPIASRILDAERARAATK